MGVQGGVVTGAESLQDAGQERVGWGTQSGEKQKTYALGKFIVSALQH